MNQILQVKNTGKNNKSKHTKDIILFFVIIIIVFGLCLGGYAIYKNVINGNIELPWGKEEPQYIPPTIVLTQDEEKLIIGINSQIEIANIKYHWNDEFDQISGTQGVKEIEKVIDIPVGENIFYLTVVDIHGKETEHQQQFILEQKPIISIAVVGNDLKITIASEIELSEITYNWQGQDVKKENMLTYEDKLSFEKKLEIPIGENILTVKAVDIEGNVAERTQKTLGKTKAVTTVVKNGEYWSFTVEGRENIKTVEFEFNGKKYLMNASTFGETKKVQYKVKLIPGINNLTITSTTQSGGVDTTTWDCEYTGQ